MERADMKVSGIHVAGIGCAATGRVTTAEAVARGWWNAAERDRSGLLSVTTAGDTPAPDLAIEAARTALSHSRHTPSQISALFHTNVHPQGPDGWSAQHYINRYTINQPVTSIEIHNGCVGFFSALHLATCHLTATTHTATLITAADNFNTPAVNRWHASSLFTLADGGGALILSKHPGFATILATQTTSDPQLEARHRAGEKLFPPGITTGATLNFEERTEYYQKTMDEKVLGRLGDFSLALADMVGRALKEAELGLDDIAKVVHDGFHYDTLRVIFLDPLDIPDDRTIWQHTRHNGHAGPLDAIRGLQQAWTNGELTRGDHVLLLSDAPGMEAACAVLRVTGTPG
jgi:3-oxoacyl-[acyl-carrier-protein] synthase III